MCSFFISISGVISVNYTLGYTTTRTRTVLRECSSLITQQVFDSSKFFWKSTCTDDCTWNLAVRHNLLRIYRFSHVKVNAETFSKILAMNTEPKTIRRKRRGQRTDITRKKGRGRWETYLIGMMDEKRIKNLNT